MNCPEWAKSMYRESRLGLPRAGGGRGNWEVIAEDLAFLFATVNMFLIVIVQLCEYSAKKS